MHRMPKIGKPSMLYLFYYTFGIIVKDTQGILDLSIPVYTVEYQSYHIDIFKDASATPEPTFYYTPACILLPNGTTFSVEGANHRYFTVKIRLWDEGYTQHIKAYLFQRTGNRHPDIRPVPFKWMRIDTIDNLQISQFGTKWKSIANRPKVASFRVRCWTDDSCDKIAESLAADSEHFASSVHLAFAYRLPNTSKSTVRIQREHLQASQMFHTINGRFPEASFVYMQKSDFDDLAREVLRESVMSSFHNDEFVDDEHLDGLLREYSRKLLQNITSTAQFTESMWNVTFWTDESQRPDVKVKYLEALVGGKQWLKRVMRGDNVTNETEISESSPTVTTAFAELRAGKGHVQWSGSGIVIKPFRLWCLALGALRGDTNFGASSVWVTKRSADFLTAAHFANRSAAPDAIVESETGISHFNQTFDKILQVIRNMRVKQTAKCDALDPKGNATWLVRDADTLWSLNHTDIVAAVRIRYVGLMEPTSECQDQEFTGTTNSFGEISLLLPKRNGLQMMVTFEVAGYYPITLRNAQLDSNSDAITKFMEPLLFVSRRNTGSGTVTGMFQDLSNGARLDSVKLDFRTDMNSYTGTVIESMTTLADGIWNATLPGGHYTVTASKSGYITVPFTVAVVGRKIRQYGKRGLSPILDNGAIRIVSLGGDQSKVLFLPLHVQGPIANKSERAHTNVHAQSIPGSFVRYEYGDYEFNSVLIEKQLAGIYRISVSDRHLINKYRSGSLWDMANSGVTVQLYTGNSLWAQYFMPNRLGNAWSVVEMNGTHLESIGEVVTVTSTEDIN